MNKKDLKDIKVLKPTLIPPIFSTIILVGVVLGMIIGVENWKSHKLLFLLLGLICCACTVVSWCNYISSYENYKDAYRKIRNDT